jgi:hypothetical protein
MIKGYNISDKTPNNMIILSNEDKKTRSLFVTGFNSFKEK